MSIHLFKLSTLAFFTTFIISCKKDTIKTEDPIPVESNLSSAEITVSLKNSSSNVIWDSLNNVNAAGNIYSIQKVNFYISNISLKRDDGYLFKSTDLFYIDPSISTKSLIQIGSIPKGNYTEISFLVGIDSTRNIDFGLSSTIDNLNMAWPTAMGGGYHFMKMEGHYIDATSTVRGYAVHLGKNKNLVSPIIIHNLTQQNSSHNYSLIFNVDEVFANPYTYNLNVDNNYTMADSSAMLKIKTNMQNAFTITQNN